MIHRITLLLPNGFVKIRLKVIDYKYTLTIKTWPPFLVVELVVESKPLLKIL